MLQRLLLIRLLLLTEVPMKVRRPELALLMRTTRMENLEATVKVRLQEGSSCVMESFVIEDDGLI